jgi:TonB-dependent SusC/RagA subfamily outer membrane receptor
MGMQRAGAVRRALWSGAPLLVVLAGCAPVMGPGAEDGPVSDLVSIGYGTQSRAEITGSVASVPASELRNAHAWSLAEILEARVPGVAMVRRPDGDYSVRIRGAHREGVLGEPLVVVDGMQVLSQRLLSILDAIPPEDVERIDVIKDGTAAVYGVHGGNGVILITTKRGR